MELLVSVIVPIYNVEKYLEKCVKSILEQSYRNLEIILVDDGSPDNCGSMCDEFAAWDNRIKVIHKPNGGLSDARNAGIEIAKGDYITCIDSDDFVHPQMIELLLEAAGYGEKDISICSYQYAYEGKDVDISTYTLQNVEEIDGREIQSVYTKPSKHRLSFTVAWGKLYKKECFKSIRYPKGKLHEDEYTTFQLLYEAKKIGFIDLPLYFYLTRENSIMGDFKPKRFDVFGGYGKRIDYYMEHKEYTYAKDTFYLGLHMMAQFYDWMDHKNEDCKEALKNVLSEWKKYKKKYSKNWDLNLIEKTEMTVLSLGFGFYYRMWKMRK